MAEKLTLIVSGCRIDFDVLVFRFLLSFSFDREEKRCCFVAAAKNRIKFYIVINIMPSKVKYLSSSNCFQSATTSI